MRLNPINFAIAILISMLLAYALWSLGGVLKNYVAVGAFIFFAGTLVPCLVQSDGITRRMLNLRVVSGLFFVLALAINGVFSVASYSGTVYVIIDGMAFLLYMLVANNIYTARQ